MRKLIFNGLVFILLLFALCYINFYVFRSDTPNLVIITLVGSVIGLLIFPYKKFFNI